MFWNNLISGVSQSSSPHCSHLPLPLYLHDLPLHRVLQLADQREQISTEIIEQSFFSRAYNLMYLLSALQSHFIKLVKSWYFQLRPNGSVLVEIHHHEPLFRSCLKKLSGLHKEHRKQGKKLRNFVSELKNEVH